MDDCIVLCVDDDPTVLQALRSLLATQLGAGHVIDVAESGDEALEIFHELQAQGRDLSLVVSDYIMPGMRGDELLVQLHSLSPHTVKIMLTGQSDVEGVKHAINSANLYRFLEKPFDNADIILTVRGGLRAWQQDRELARQNMQLRRHNEELEQVVAERTAELREKNAALERLSVTDCLTGLSNRLRLDQVLEQEMARMHRFESRFSLLLLDIDKFKLVNDTHGHQAGDQVLVALADTLRDSTRDCDVVGRWGGEEFLVIASGTELDGAAELAEKLRERVAALEFPVVGSKTASFGVTACRADDSITAMIGRADEALYRAKELGRNRVELAP